ncbi:MAG: DUF3817 domain-containing protein [Bacteroidetes bacterium]|nr:DUF3817 domain-containing protein [Bacteroidota bacterium]
MKDWYKTSLGKFKMAGIVEGFSYIFLLFIAMPLKYAASMPMAVTYTGWMHGILFMLYLLALIQVTMDLKWGFKKVALAFLAALIPFGTFIFNRSLHNSTVTTS